ncbi:MAG: phosphate-starvation-inducible PsiE family protein [Mastigocoleus sp.]
MMLMLRKIREFGKNESFLHFVEFIEISVSKVLSFLMILVIIAATINLIIFLIYTLFDDLFLQEKAGGFSKSLFTVFGLFLNILIALEILENITAYLRKHVFQVELVIATSLIAVARKIIILDLNKTTENKVIGLGIIILALSISYWIVRKRKKP